MRISEFRLVIAPEFNNGNPGGVLYWVVFDNSDQSPPVVCETLDQALEAIRQRVARAVSGAA
jgi:hypothetical protein